MTCDVCDLTSDTEVFAGRWIFYCKEHQGVDRAKTYENEIEPSMQNGDFSYILNDGELSEMVSEGDMF